MNQLIGGFGITLVFLSGCAISEVSLSQVKQSHTQIEGNTMVSHDERPLPIKTSSSSARAAASERSTTVFPDDYPEAASLPLISTLSGASAYEGKLVRLVGQYVEVDVRMQPVGAPRYAGHVAIVLADQAQVSLLPTWDKTARRPQSEIDRFKNKQVEAVGVFYSQAPPEPQGGASLLKPCLSDIKAVYFSMPSS